MHKKIQNAERKFVAQMENWNGAQTILQRNSAQMKTKMQNENSSLKWKLEWNTNYFATKLSEHMQPSIANAAIAERCTNDSAICVAVWNRAIVCRSKNGYPTWLHIV